ncbi:MAG: DNA helicase RecQ [Magnetococcales bacterium]|nr:DNA helicase RecQ [Magnetococcales bacterium]
MPESQALSILSSIFGFNSFRGAQEEIINHLIQGQSALVLMPTGGGKSLCFQIPALIRPGLAVVISPLIALMHDQVTSLQQLGVRAATLNSSQSAEQNRNTWRAIASGEIDLLYMAPERLLNEQTLEFLKQRQIALLAIDEAHCVSQWGHDFRPDYLGLSILSEHFPDVPMLALTATADAPTQSEIIKRLNLGDSRVFIAGFDRPNIRYRITAKNRAKNQLLDLLRTEHADDAGIVYCMSRRKTEDIAEFLRNEGFNALAYHAGLPDATRKRHQDRFLLEEGVIVVATIAFGMGIDKPNVRFVAHLDPPKSIEAYYQETGRAGRDGLPATAWMSYGLEDVVKLRQMMANSDAEERFKRIENQKLDALLGLCETTECRRQALLRYFGEELKDPCGNCDTCLTPVETWDGLEAAQKALSCVFRTGQRFGVSYLSQVLRGKSSDRMESFGHTRVSTFGIGEDLDDKTWRSVYRQLVAMGFLSVDMEGYGGLKLTERSRPVLRGAMAVKFRKEPKRLPRTKTRSAKKSLPDNVDPILWEKLRQLRLSIAKEQSIPPYIVFHDTTLQALIQIRPRTMLDMRSVPGVGDKKLENYGEIFLKALWEE